MTRVIVCDTGPLLHLSEAGVLDLLPGAGEILLPPLVAEEYQANAQGWYPPQWTKIVKLEGRARRQAERWVKENRLDAGEAEAIALALQERADWLLTDDAQARQFAESLDLETHGSIGVLLWGAASGRFETKAAAQEALDRLASSSLWISKRVLLEARKALDVLFA